MINEQEFTQQTYCLRGVMNPERDYIKLIVIDTFGTVLFEYLTQEDILLGIYKNALELDETIRFSGNDDKEQEYIPIGLRKEDYCYRMMVTKKDS